MESDTHAESGESTAGGGRSQGDRTEKNRVEKDRSEKGQIEGGRPDAGRRQFLKFAGAAGVASVVPTTGRASARQADRGGSLRVAQQSDVGNLDPHKTQDAPTLRILNNVYETLTRIDGDLRPVGRLANEWQVGDDGTTWTFTLREGVRFHPPEDRAMTANDVKASIERVLADETNSPWASNFEPVETIRAEDDRTVVFELSQPFAPFLVKLSNGFVVPEGVDDADYDIANQPVGTGPFVFEETVTQTRTTLSRFGDYWGTDGDGDQLPYLDELEFRPIPEGQARVTALQTGEVDYVTEVPQTQAQSLQNASGITFSAIPGTFYDYIGQNTEAAPLDDVNLRQAISWAIDRESMVQGARFGFAEPTQDPISPASEWDDLIQVDEPYSQDRERARQLVEESTYDGEQLTIQVGQEFEGQVNEAEIAQAQLSEVGLNVTIQPTEFSTLINNLNEGNFQLTVLGWATLVDPDDLFFLQFHTGETFNQTNYSNEEVDRLLEQGRQATGSIEERAQFYDDAIDIIAREAPYTFLVYNDEIDAWRDSVQGVEHVPTGVPFFADVSKQG
ncbi:ABC transporter substrate-binding protein [Halorussus salinisoli]|uniref:ABC transporter substrate-binding protein n=1 Tax=Halorussus salinisoli TaxID=2558242 RepID=UPI00148537C4|nr:ABC transporter substrate-binding protein [Halorussus salinisoli]